MARYRIEDTTDRVRRAIEAELKRRLTRCLILVWSHWKKLISVEGAGVGKSGKLVYGEIGRAHV